MVCCTADCAGEPNNAAATNYKVKMYLATGFCYMCGTGYGSVRANKYMITLHSNCRFSPTHICTSVQCSSESEACSLCCLDLQVALLLLPTELFREWRTLMRWLRGTVTCDQTVKLKLHVLNITEWYSSFVFFHQNPYLFRSSNAADKKTGCSLRYSTPTSCCYFVNMI